MEDTPRYLIVTLDDSHRDSVQRTLQRFLQPGDRIVSIYPVFTRDRGGDCLLNALVELRHPSWKDKPNVGFAAIEHDEPRFY